MFICYFHTVFHKFSKLFLQEFELQLVQVALAGWKDWLRPLTLFKIFNI